MAQVKRAQRPGRKKAQGRKQSKFKVVKKAPRLKFKDRFQKFYYLHRDDLNKHRRTEYALKKRKGVCVKCALKRIGKSIFCKKHLQLSRVYNRRRTGA